MSVDGQLTVAGEPPPPPTIAVVVAEPKTRVALAPPHLRARDQLAEMRIAAFVFDEKHDARAVFEGELAADDCGDPAPARVRRKAHRAIQAVAVGQRDRLVAVRRPSDHEETAVRVERGGDELGEAIVVLADQDAQRYVRHEVRSLPQAARRMRQ